MIQVPLTNQPNQSLQIVIPLGERNVALGLFMYWNAIANYWQLNVSDASTGNDLISGLPLLLSPPLNMLEQWEYLEIGRAFIIPLTDSAKGNPGLNDWETNFALVWGE